METTSGQAGRVLDPVSLTWSDELNRPGGGKLKVNKSDLAGLERRRFQPWAASVVACYVRPDGVEVPWVGGPITNRPTETLRTIEMDWAGMREVFRHRVIDNTLSLSGTTLGQMMWSVAERGMQKPGGLLPLVHGTSVETGTEGATFDGWNLANTAIDKIWDELSELDFGPDLMLRPRWAEYGTRFEWEMVHGTKAQPTIHQSWTASWDTTAARSDVVDLEITSDASGLASRVWATGSGEGAGTLIGSATDLRLVDDGYPFLESVVSDRDAKTVAQLSSTARGRLGTARQPIDQLSLTVRADSTKNLLGRWHAGDAAYVTLGPDWDCIPEGRHLMRIIKASGDLTEKVTIEMQEDQW